MSLQTRAMVACGFFGLAFTGLSYRLVELALDANAKLTDNATKAYGGQVTLFARRGEIRDVNGEALALNEPLKNIIADTTLLFELEPKEKDGVVEPKFDDRDRVAGVLAKVLDLKFDEVRARFEPDAKTDKLNRYVVIKKKVSEEKARILELALIESKLDRMRTRAGADRKKLDDLKALEKAKTLADANVRGIVFEQNFERIYPVGSLLARMLSAFTATSRSTTKKERN